MPLGVISTHRCSIRSLLFFSFFSSSCLAARSSPLSLSRTLSGTLSAFLLLLLYSTDPDRQTDSLPPPPPTARNQLLFIQLRFLTLSIAFSFLFSSFHFLLLLLLLRLLLRRAAFFVATLTVTVTVTVTVIRRYQLFYITCLPTYPTHPSLLPTSPPIHPFFCSESERTQEVTPSHAQTYTQAHTSSALSFVISSGYLYLVVCSSFGARRGNGNGN